MPKNQVNVSVIMLHYRRPVLIMKSIESLLAQTVWPKELIILDDCSPFDEYWRMAMSVKRRIPPEIRWVIDLTPYNQGCGRASQTAIEMSTQPYIAYLDSDDLWRRDKLEEQYLSYTDTAFLKGLCFTGIDHDWGLQTFGARHWEDAFKDAYLGKIPFVPRSSQMIPRDMLAIAGGHSPLRQADDLATALRVMMISKTYSINQVMLTVPKSKERDKVNLTGGSNPFRRIRWSMDARWECAQLAQKMGKYKELIPMSPPKWALKELVKVMKGQAYTWLKKLFR